MSNPVSALIDRVSQAIEKLRSLTQISIQASWKYCDEDFSIEEAVQPESWKSWTIAELNARNHVAWSKGRNVRWLGQTIVIPHALQGYPLEGLCLRVALTWWAESAQIFVNGQLVQEGDLFDCSTRLLVSPDAVPGEEIAIALRLISPGHDDGALVRSLCLYEAPSSNHPLEPSFIADELAVLQTYLKTFAPEKLQFLTDAVAQMDWSTLSTSERAGYSVSFDLPQPLLSNPPLQHPTPHTPHPIPHTRHPFDQTLANLRDRLLPLSTLIKQRKISLLGHAHLDMAWLWAVDETWEAAERTFESVLALQKDFPELIFCHSTPALYNWIERNRPDLFKRIQEQAKTGKWEVIGGLWVEPELNIINGESIVRHILYGQRYFEEKFGSINRIAWLPDSFGFTWQLPQFLKQGGIDYFVTQKLRWNDTTKFPYELFQWQAPDGTQVFSLMSSLIGESIDPVKMANYACDWEAKTGIPLALWLPGVGDHGGGPTRDMLEVARRWQRSPFFPETEFTTAENYLQQLEQICCELEPSFSELKTQNSKLKTFPTSLHSSEGRHEGTAATDSTIPSPLPTPDSRLPTPDSLPTWNSELYLEFHRGCYTSHADQKQYNRQCERLLYQAELWASLATLAIAREYPKAELEAAWKKVLFNQFHDILPGSSIPQVFTDANIDWKDAEAIGQTIIESSLEAIANQISVSPPHPDARLIVVFNSLNWERSEVVEITVPTTKEEEPNFSIARKVCYWKVCDHSGAEVESQAYFSKAYEHSLWKLSFVAENVPSVGYRCFWLCPYVKGQVSSELDHECLTLENEFLRVALDPATGNLSSVFDKVHQREVLNAPGNQLQFFQDQGQYWDAWNIDPSYAQYPLPPAELVGIYSEVQGPVETRIQVHRRTGQSLFKQTYSLQKASPILKIDSSVDWQERHVLAKAAFPLKVEANNATYEIPCGAIQRTTRPQTDYEKAQWEVPALGWADLSDRTYGISILTDYKHGFDSQPNQLRLTLLRGSEWPDPDADRGHHHFTYALYPHGGNWQDALTVQRSYELRQPLIVVQGSKRMFDKSKVLPEPPPCLPILRGSEVESSPELGDLGGECRVLNTFQTSSKTKEAQPGILPSAGKFLDLGAETLVLMAFKQSENSSNEWILRLYECHGENAELNLQSDLNLSLGEAVDLLERSTNSHEVKGQTVTVHPWKIASFKISAN